MDGPHFSVGWGGLGPIPDKQQSVSQPWHYQWQAMMQSIYAQLFTKAGAGFQPNEPAPFFGLDAARWSRETMAPRDYMNGDYYSYWLTAICTFIQEYGPAALGISEEDLVRRRICTPQQLQRSAAIRRKAFRQAVPGVNGPSHPGQLAGLFSSAEYDPKQAGSVEAIGRRPRFQVGNRVRVRHLQGNWHTRCYPYVRGCVGTVMVFYGLSDEQPGRFDGKYHGPYPEVASQSRQKFYAPVYGVRFQGADVFGDVNVDPRLRVHLDLWEPHLELV
jgi:nitrile hydratase